MRRLEPLFVLVVAAGCHPRYTPEVPQTVAVERVADRQRPPCVLSPERVAPTAGTPRPEGTGELKLQDVIGSDRLGAPPGSRSTLSADGASIVSLTRDRVLFWEVATGRLRRTILLQQPFDGRLRSVSVSPDGRWGALTGEVSGEPGVETRVLNLETEQVVFTKSLSGPVEFASDSQTARLQWFEMDLAAGTIKKDPEWGPHDYVLPGARRLARLEPKDVTDRPRAFVWELRTSDGRVLHRFPPASRVATSGDGERLAAFDVARGRVVVYDLRSYESVAVVEQSDAGDLFELSPNGSKLLLNSMMCATLLSSEGTTDPGCKPPRLALLDVASGRELWRQDQLAGPQWIFSKSGQFLTGPRTRLVESLLRVEDGAELQALRGGRALRVLALSDDDRVALFNDGRVLPLSELPTDVPSVPEVVALAPDGRTHVEKLGTPEGVELRLIRNGRCTLVEARPGPNDLLSFVDSELLVTTRRDEAEGLWVEGIDTATGQVRYTLHAKPPVPASVVLAGGHVLIQGLHNPKVLRFDVNSGTPLQDGGAPRLRYASPGGGYVYRVRARNGDMVSPLSMPIAGDGRTALLSTRLADRWNVSRWDLDQPDAVVDHLVPAEPVRIAVMPGAAAWAIGDKSGGLYLLKAGSVTPLPVTHSARVTALLFSPDGKRLFTAGADGTILAIDPRTRDVVGRASLPLDYAEHLAVDPSRGVLVAETARGQRVTFSWSR